MSDSAYEGILNETNKVSDEIQEETILKEKLEKVISDRLHGLINTKDEEDFKNAVKKIIEDLVQEGFEPVDVVEFLINQLDDIGRETHPLSMESILKEMKLKEQGETFDIMFDDLTEEAQRNVLEFVGESDPAEMNWDTSPVAVIPQPEEDEEVTAPEDVFRTESKTNEKDEDKDAKIKKEKAKKEKEEKEKAAKVAKAEKEKKAKAKESKVIEQEVKEAEELLKSYNLSRKDDTTDEQVVEAAKHLTQIADMQKKTNESADVSKDVSELIKQTKDALTAGDYVKAADLAGRLSAIQQTIPDGIDADAAKAAKEDEVSPPEKEAFPAKEEEDNPCEKDESTVDKETEE